jgi:MFS family permease
LTLLASTQVIGGVGVAIGISVGALLAAQLGGTGISGVAQSSSVIGGALLAVPVVRLIQGNGRRPGLAVAYLAGALGAVLVVLAARAGSVPLLLVGMFLFGGGSAANLQARYAAVDLAEPQRRGRQLSLVVWATTVGAVAGPNLAPLAGSAVSGFGLPPLAGPFAFSALAFVVAAVVLHVLLRPDPLLLSRSRAAATEPATEPARAVAPAGGPAGGPVQAEGGAPAEAAGGAAAAGGAQPAGPRPGLVEAYRAVAAVPAARLGISAVAVGHLVMVGVMSMAPVHIGLTHSSADTLRLVGIVLSLHIAGMYAAAPVMGYLTDRLGRKQVILTGIGLLLVACAVAGTAGHNTPQLAVGMGLLGLGWSGTMVAGSTLLSESVSASVRPAAQGLSDVVMGIAGASAGALSGIVVEWNGYPTLALFAALATVPLAALALRPVRLAEV